MLSDTELLDFLDACTLPDEVVCMRDSMNLRGWRLHVVPKSELEHATTAGITTFKTVREAIQHWYDYTEG